jgi:hypothetical protein
MSGIYTPGGPTPAEKAAAEAEKATALSPEQMAELLKQAATIDPGLRILCLEAPLEQKAGRIILPDTSDALKKMGCKRFMVLKPTRDMPSAMKNAEWKLEALKSDARQPLELEVRELEFGDYVWAPPFAASKLPIVTTGLITTIEIMNWGDVMAIQKKSDLPQEEPADETDDN